MDPRTKPEPANLRNVLILSVGFMLLMAAWLTTAGIEVIFPNQIYIISIQAIKLSFSCQQQAINSYKLRTLFLPQTGLFQSTINIAFSQKKFCSPGNCDLLGYAPYIFGLETCFRHFWYAAFTTKMLGFSI